MRSPRRSPPGWLGGFVLGQTPLGGAFNDFPVAAGVQVTLPSYLYQQWTLGLGSDDLGSFVGAYNAMTQSYVDWFATVSLPVYIKQSGSLLDWVALGLYGFLRPLLPVGIAVTEGPVASPPAVASGLAVAAFRVVRPATYYATTDDVFKRIITWYLYRGDGKRPNVSWIKRRVMRFLIGVNGTGGYPIVSDVAMSEDSFGVPVYWPTLYNIDDTSAISVIFAGDEATIRISPTIRTVTGGALPGYLVPGGGLGAAPGAVITTSVAGPTFPMAPTFKAAVDDGILEFPGPYSWTVELG